MSNSSVQQIKAWLEFRNYTLDNFVAAKKILSEQVEFDAEKYQLSNLVLVRAENLSAHVYFYTSGKFAIMNIYGEGLEQLSAADLISFYGEPEARARSRAGKTANYHIYAKEGFAFSSKHNDNEVHYVDLFPAVPVATYIENIYEAPGPFIR